MPRRVSPSMMLFNGCHDTLLKPIGGSNEVGSFSLFTYSTFSPLVFALS
nr:hypothetical protein P5640_10495 [Bacillus subtilis]